MERTTETLSTRDLASPNEQTRGATTSEGDARDAPTPEEQTPGGMTRRRRRGGDTAFRRRGTQPPADQRTRPMSRPGPPPTSRRALGARPATGGPARDQTVEAGSPMPAWHSAACPPMRPRTGRRAGTDGLSAGSGQRRSALFDGRGGLRLNAGGSLLPADWTPRSKNGGRRSRPGSSTSPEAPSRTPMAWSPTSCSNSQRASPRNASGSKRSGVEGRTSRPRICGSLFSATAVSSNGCCQPEPIDAGSL